MSFVSSLVVNLLAALALGLLKAVWARGDLKESVRLEIANGALELAAKASAWLARAVTAPDGGAGLRVVEGAESVRLPGPDPDPPGGASRAGL